MAEPLRPFESLEEALGIHFHDLDLLRQAFVHRSYLNEAGEDFPLPDNERLEFLGDSVLGFIAADLLYHHYPELSEGELTSLRAALVRRETLAQLARRFHLGDYLYLGHGEEDSGGRTRPATLCAAFEALVGAVYLDQGLETVRDLLEPLLLAEARRAVEKALAKDPKSRLQEWMQSHWGVTPRYRTVATEGPEHARVFTVQVTANKVPYGVGRGRSKQEAGQAAAAMALHRLGQPAPEYVSRPDLEAQYPLGPIPPTEPENGAQAPHLEPPA